MRADVADLPGVTAKDRAFLLDSVDRARVLFAAVGALTARVESGGPRAKRPKRPYSCKTMRGAR